MTSKRLLIVFFIVMIAYSCGGAGGDVSITDGVESLEHRLFVTSTQTTGLIEETGFSAGIESANAICERLAEAAGLERRYIAILSDSNKSAAERIIITGAIFTLAGTQKTKIAEGSTSFWNSENTELLNQIRRDETGTFLAEGQVVWSGSDSDGSANVDNCNDWKVNASTSDGNSGIVGQLDADWITNTDTQCNQSARLYCISQQ